MKRREILISAATIIGVSGCASSNSTESEPTQSTPQNNQNRRTSERNPELTGEILGNYQAGYDGLKVGKDLLDTSLDSFGNENFSLVKSSMSGFQARMDNIAGSFSEASSAAEELGEASVVRAAEAGEREASNLGTAGMHLAKGAEAAAKKNYSESETRLSQAQTALKNARDAHKEVLTPSEVESKL
jgi:hypothetical protein